MKKFPILLFGVFLILFSCSAPTADITILHWNDFHSANTSWIPTHYNDEGHSVGGYALFDAYLDSLQGVFPEALRVHAGDDFQGSPVCAVTKGLSQIEILNAVKPDFFTIGNHEFDYSWEYLDSLRLNAADFAMYAANLVDKETGESPVPQYRIFKRGRYRFAMIGLTHPELDFLTMPQNLEGVYVDDPISTAKDLIARLKRQGIDLFIVVSHMGIQGDRKLAAAVPDVDLIIGGHSHTYMREAEQVDGVWIVQADDRGRYVGLTRFHVDRGDITSLKLEYVETVAGKLKPSPDVAEIVNNYEDDLREKMDKVIGELKTPWIRSGGESNIGNWIADSFIKATGADIAIMNNGGIRKNLAAGEIMVRDIWEIAPFGNTVVTFEWTGSELLDALNYMAKEGSSLQFSGISVVLQRNKGLLDVRVNNKAVDKDKKYTVATNNYTASQVEKYFGLKVPEIIETGLIDRDVMIRAILDDPVIVSKTEGRIVYK